MKSYLVQVALEGIENMLRFGDSPPLNDGTGVVHFNMMMSIYVIMKYLNLIHQEILSSCCWKIADLSTN